MSKLTLQIVMGLLAIIPVATGLLGLLGVEDPFYVAVGMPPIVILDTNLRFYSGVWLGLGLSLCWLIPSIEKRTVPFRVIWAMIFIGGVGRLLSMLVLTWPPFAFVAFTALEIVGAPFFIWWQSRVSKYERRHVAVIASKVTAGFELANTLSGNELWLWSGRRERNQDTI